MNMNCDSKILTVWFYAAIVVLLVLNSEPNLKDLYNLITPEYAAHWKVIGILLGIKKGILDGIERNFPSNVSWCCNELLDTWLERDTNASWKKIIEVINSPAVATLITGNTTVTVDPQQGNYKYCYAEYSVRVATLWCLKGMIKLDKHTASDIATYIKTYSMHIALIYIHIFIAT